ncbi:MAG: hypothetical protein Q9220_004841 [cf. Caloplaca sp. 1 TL-2023]
MPNVHHIAALSCSLEEIPCNSALLIRENQKEDRSELDRPGWQESNGIGFVDAQVVINISLSRSHFFATVDYLPSILSVISAPNVASVYANALQTIMRDPAQIVRDVDLLTARDVERLRGWNQSFPQKVDACIHDLVLQHTETRPHAPAICSWDGNLTYQELDQMSARLAKVFIGAGVRCEMLLPVCFQKSLLAVVAMVAIHRAGAAFVPLDPSHPKDRLKAIIEKAEAKMVITSSETATLFQGIPVDVLDVASSTLDPTEPPPDCPLPDVRPDQAAFVLFTSGSTGNPKGIVQEHRSVCTSSLAMGRAMRVTSKSRVFQYAAFTFDVSMMDIFMTLIHGACICIPSEEERMGSFTLAMNRMRVNWVLFTPSVASLVSPEDVPGLETLVYGGEAVKQENVSRWVGKVRTINCYGPAECGACAIGEYIRPDSRPANVGRQFGAELCWVVDPENHDIIVPIGAVGELVVEGPTLARGYLNDLIKTQAAFAKAPRWPLGLQTNRTRRIYKTGDLVRQNSDGTFDFVGRKDLQVKVRGQRVEIGEVEHHLSTYPGVALSIVARPQSGAYAHTLVAIVQVVLPTAASGPAVKELSYFPDELLSAANFDGDQLRRFLNGRLPGYMVPTHIIVVNKLPLSVSGKIERKVVDAWLVRTARPSEPFDTSKRLETLLARENSVGLEICSQVLSMVSEPGSAFYKSLDGTDFVLTAVGLDSIKIISLIMFLRQRFGVRVPLETVMDPKASIRALSDIVVNVSKGDLATLEERKVNVMDTFRTYRQKAMREMAREEGPRVNVLLTGATGFLGIRILRQLCQHPAITRVLLHVRSRSPPKAMQRIIESAQQAGWWKDDYRSKLEIWIGDLARPRLGLHSNQWDRVRGQAVHPSENVTAIIHNGATVNWNANFDALKAVNVDSTIELLKAISESVSLTDFAFVSGGQQLRPGTDDDDIIIAEEVTEFNGYAQSKFVSELMVKEYARDIAPRRQQISVVKPGYIVGSREDGRSVTDDYIWRLTAACKDIKSYNADDANSWLFISDVGRVARAVFDCCYAGNDKWSSDRGAKVVKILDGLAVSEYWSIVKQKLGCEVNPTSADSWTAKLFGDIEMRGEKHPLWPLLQTVEKGRGLLGSPCHPTRTMEDSERRIKAVIRKNIEYLIDIGFLERGESPEPRHEIHGESMSQDWKGNNGFIHTVSEIVA